MTFSSEQIERARELASEQRKHDAILRLLLVTSGVQLAARQVPCAAKNRTGI